MRIPSKAATAAVVLLCTSMSAPAATLNVGGGSSFNLGSGTLAMNCGDVNVSGTLNGGTALLQESRHSTINPGGFVNAESATFEVTGDWTNNGTFDPDTSTVTFLDGCSTGDATVSGDTTFYNLNWTTVVGRTMFFEAGATQTIINFLNVFGSPTGILFIRSTVPDQLAFTTLLGSHFVEWVDVKDNHADASIIGPAEAPEFDSIKGPKSDGWFIPGAVIPTLSVWGMLVFVLLIMGVTGRRLRRSPIRTT